MAGLELAPVQRGLWLHERLLPLKTVYQIAKVVRLAGDLDVAALRQALQGLLERHEALRSRFVASACGPLQEILPTVPLDLEFEDLSGLEPQAREAEFQRRANEEAGMPFDLEQGPLFRVRLLRLAPSEHGLLLTFHHLVADEWSFGLICREIEALYAASRPGRALAAPASQYPDYVRWQRDWLDARRIESQLAYWRQALAGLPVLELPTDRRRPPLRSHRGRRHHFVLDQDLSVGLSALAQQERTTRFTVLLAGLQVLLHRYSGQDDFAVGVPVAGRRHGEFDATVGMFVNTLVMRAHLDGSPSFRDFLCRTHAVTRAAYAHQDLPFEQLLQALRPVRDPARSPLFQVMLNGWPQGGQRLDLEGLASATVEARCTGTAKFDLSFTMVERDGQLHGMIEYATDLFDAATVQRLAWHWEILLRALVRDPECAIGKLELLTAPERDQLLSGWNDTAASCPSDQCLHELFEQQAARNPTALALVSGDQALTYGELNARANRLAHHLHSLGVGPDELVGVCLERSLDLVVVLLGVLKAGGAYLPLDPGYPPERLAYMLGDSAVRLVLTQQSLLGRLDGMEAKVFCLDRDGVRLAALPAYDPVPLAGPRDLAYVIYTSGSTGRPKGVMVEHGNVVRLFAATASWFEFGPSDVWSGFHSYAFDFSVWEIWGALLHGGKLVIVSQEVVRDSGLFHALLRREGVTVLNQTPSAFRQLIEADARASVQALPDLRLVIFGGEALDFQILRPWFERHGDQTPRLVNMYGITETTVHVTYRPVRMGDLEQDRGSLIGCPIPDLSLYLLDRQLQPVPIGVTGEIVVGGAGVARGYLNRPELTAGRFIPDPFSADATGRWYRSGDLARRLPSGDIEYLGRLDDQVKLRGFRIELGEVEAALTRQPGVRQAVVVVREDRPGERRLVGYVVGDGTLEAARLRVALKASLPEYMVPAAIEVLPALPLTANGKVDRQALPAPRGDGEGATPVAARDPLEEAVAAVWGELLERAEVGAHEDFFELGGHSLLAVRVVGRLRELFGVELPVRALFEAPTVAGLAQRVRDGLDSDAGTASEPLRVGERPATLPLSFAQQRLWFLAHWEPGGAQYNIPVGWWLEGALDVGRLHGALDALLRRHEVLRTALVSHGGEPCQQVRSARSLVLDRVDVSGGGLESARAQALEQAGVLARGGFDLGQAPLLRAALYRVGPEQHLLALVVHHVAADGWSLGVLGRELGLAYAGRMHELGEPALQYADYALWQRGQLQGEALRAQLGYWRERLAGLQPLELPSDRPRPAQPSSRGAVELVSLDPGLTRQLRELGRREGATLYMVLLAAFQLLLHRYSGQDDIAVGSPVAGRGRRELEGLVGFFVNTLVLRTDLRGNPTFRQLLAQVREHALGAYAHQELPFERLVEALRPQREAGHGPLVQVMFALQNTPHEPLALPGLRVRRQALETASAKFDLTLSLVEHGTAAGLEGGIEYASDLFDAATVRRLARHWEVLLRALVREPDRAVGELELLTAPEREQLLVGWNQTAAPYPSKQCIHELFEQQAARSPMAIALVCGEQEVSYGELNARANRLAHHLRCLGVGPDELVGICLERSVELVVGMLAILKAGGAYVPLDPGYPNERLVYMLGDSAARLVLSQQSLLGRLDGVAGEVFCLDRDAARLAGLPQHDPGPLAGPRHLAYVIYTSGSTGRPKGVMIEHRALVNHMAWMRAEFGFCHDDAVLQKTPVSFDAAMWEFHAALLYGGRLVLAAPDAHRDPAAIVAALRRHRITTLQLVPSLFSLLADEPGLADCSSLRRVFCGGEVLPAEAVQRFQARSKAQVINLYGPTETCIDSAWWVCPRDAGLASVPIGRPVANTRLYVLDACGQPVPVGVPGELQIGGAGLARGYWRRPELTAQRFVPDPFEAGGRLYRTGDRVRYLPWGDLEYLGRFDDQVKLRGLRIELGEVEAALTRQPGVRQAVTMVREDRPGDRRLVAYVVAERQAQELEPARLRAALKASLPDYMVPAVIEVWPALPLTPNGKVNRKALPAPGGQEPDGSQLLARDPLEEAVAAVWCELLDRSMVGVHEDFFELGGHSLLAVRVLGRLRARFGVELPVRALFEAPTVAGLAQRLRTVLARVEPLDGLDFSSLVPIRSQGAGTPFFCVHPVGGSVLCYADLVRHLAPDQPVYGLQHPGMDGQAFTHGQIEDLAACYLQEMYGLQPQGPYLLGGWSMGGVIAYEIARTISAHGKEVQLLALFDSELGHMGHGNPGGVRDEVAQFLRHLVGAPKGQVEAALMDCAASSAEDMLADVLPQARDRGWLGADVSDTDLLRWYRVYRGNLKALASYVPGVDYSGPIILFRRSENLADAAGLGGWDALADADLAVFHVPGDHFSMLREPHVGTVARYLNQYLYQAGNGYETDS